MIKYFAFFAYISLLFSMCDYKETNQSPPPSSIPPSFQSMLDANGYDTWQKAKGLEFTISKPNMSEKYLVDLQSRNVKLESDAYSIVKNDEGLYVSPSIDSFGGDPNFYYSVYYYFVAMPYVLADPGIIYESLTDFTLNDTLAFDGVKVAYQDNVGDAPKDEYIVLWDKKTLEMKYLLYTVTYFSNETSTNWSAKEYKSWKNVRGVKLPTEMTSYSLKDFRLTEEKSTISINDLNISFESYPSETFTPPSQAEKWESN